MGRFAPRPAAEALRAARQRAAPATPLAAAQASWADAVGPSLAAATEPIAEKDGTLTVRCESAVWAQELEMMGAELLARLGEHLGAAAPRVLRFEARRSS